MRAIKDFPLTGENTFHRITAGNEACCVQVEANGQMVDVFRLGPGEWIEARLHGHCVVTSDAATIEVIQGRLEPQYRFSQRGDQSPRVAPGREWMVFATLRDAWTNRPPVSPD